MTLQRKVFPGFALHLKVHRYAVGLFFKLLLRLRFLLLTTRWRCLKRYAHMSGVSGRSVSVHMSTYIYGRGLRWTLNALKALPLKYKNGHPRTLVF